MQKLQEFFRLAPVAAEVDIRDKIGAGNETRTRDFHLGKVVLYQLSYSRFADAF